MKIFTDIVSKKIILFFIVIFSIGIPLNSLFSIILFFSITLIILFASLKSYINTGYLSFIIFLCLLTKFLLPTLKIQEGHNLLVLNDNSIDFYKKNLPNEVFNSVEKIYEEYFSNSKCSAAVGFCWKYFNPDRNYLNSGFTRTKFAKSSNWSFEKIKYSRILENINFTNLKTARIEVINNIDYNFVFPEKYDLSRETIPYFTMIDINKRMVGGSFCWKGHTFWETKNNIYKNLYNNNYKCKEIITKDIDKKFYAINFSSTVSISKLNELYSDKYVSLNDTKLSSFINKNELILKYKKNNLYFTLDIIKNILTVLILISIIIFCFNQNRINLNIYFFSLIYTFLFLVLTYFVHEDLLNGFTVYTGGNDGIIYSSYANKMFFELKNYNIYEFFRGAENIFYFMPGIRYFFALSKVFFGESNYGYLFISFLYPLVVFQLFKILINVKVSIIITSIFF